MSKITTGCVSLQIVLSTQFSLWIHVDLLRHGGKRKEWSDDVWLAMIAVWLWLYGHCIPWLSHESSRWQVDCWHFCPPGRLVEREDPLCTCICHSHRDFAEGKIGNFGTRREAKRSWFARAWIFSKYVSTICLNDLQWSSVFVVVILYILYKGSSAGCQT